MVTLAQLAPIAPLAGRSAPPRTRGRQRRRPAPAAIGALVLLALLLAAAALGPWLLGIDPARQSLTARFTPPLGFGGGWAHPVGTDHLGRDLLARALVALRLSLASGVVAALAAAAIGATLGLLAGLRPGRVDAAVVFLLDVALAAPFIVVAIALAVTLGGGWTATMITLIATGWAAYARVLRLDARALRAAPFIEASRCAGAGDARLLLRHLLPNVAGSLVVLVTQQAAAMILYEAALSYLGLGLRGDVVTLGGMIADGQESLLRAWWVATLPGVVLVVIVLAFTLGGDWLAARGRLSPTTPASTALRWSRAAVVE